MKTQHLTRNRHASARQLLEALEDRMLLSSAPPVGSARISARPITAKTAPKTTAAPPAPFIFDAAYYLSLYPDVAAAVNAGTISAWNHFRLYGKIEGRDPSSFFSPQLYLSNNPDVAAALAKGQFQSAFDHYLNYGMREGRVASTNFSESYYLATNADVAAAVKSGALTCGLQHFILYGRTEGRLGTAPIRLTPFPSLPQPIEGGFHSGPTVVGGTVIYANPVGGAGGSISSSTAAPGSILTTSVINRPTSDADAVQGTLNLTNNRMIIQTANPSEKSAAILALNEAIFGAGFDGGSNSAIIRVSADPSGPFDPLAPSSPRTFWAGDATNVDPNSILITARGDLNGDGLVNIDDIIIMASNFNRSGTLASGDVNGDGVVNFADLPWPSIT